MNDENTSVKDLKKAVGDFIQERQWEKYHNPKDLAESVSIEASELLQLFQWRTAEESERFGTEESKVQRVKEELSDVVIYCLSMANKLGIDLSSAILDKLEHDKSKYPTNLYKGKAHPSFQRVKLGSNKQKK